MSAAQSPPPGPAPGLDDAVFRSLFDNYPDAILVVDETGAIRLANSNASTLLGYGLEELLGLQIDVLVPDAARAQHAAHRRRYAQAPRRRPMGSQVELSARRKDGREVRVEIALSPLRELGFPLVVAAIRDVSDYPRVRQALRRARYSEQLAALGRFAVHTRDVHALLDHACELAANALEAPVAQIFLMDEDPSEFRVASAVGAIPSELVGARVANRPDTPPGFAISQRGPVVVNDYREETRFSVPPAYLHAGLLSALAVPLSDRERVVGAMTVRSKLARQFGQEEVRFLESLANLLATGLQRARTEDALNHAQRMESVGHLTGGISHDFNNLLTVILGNLQVLEELPFVSEDANARQLVASAMRATRRGAELTAQLLAFSRRQVLQPAPVDVKAMLHSLASMLRRTLDQRVHIVVDVEVDCPRALADPAQLESAVLNIAINARDAMPEGGTLRFLAEARPELDAQMRSYLDDPDGFDRGFVSIQISDTGVGMTEEVKRRAFEPFFTTKEAGRGTGLGLSSVYGFVKQSKGAVAIESARGAGTTITLCIPQPRWADDELDGAGSNETAIPAGLRVLMVEDEAEVRKVVQALLGGLGCEVIAAGSGEQALHLLEEHGGVDVLLSDVALGPGMLGTQLAAEAQRRHPQVQVLLMSGFPQGHVDPASGGLSDWELIQKPFTREALARTLARLAAGRPAAPH